MWGRILKMLKKNLSNLASTADPQTFQKSPSKWKRSDKIYTMADIIIPKGTPDWNLSSSVLRHSSSSYSMPKSQRFKVDKVPYNDNMKLYLKSSLSQKSTSLGFGNRSNIPLVFMDNKCSATIDVPFY